MDIKDVLFDMENYNKRFDEIDKDYLDNLDISSFLKLENNLNNDLNRLKEIYTNIDLIYLNYCNIKKNIYKKIIKSESNIDYLKHCKKKLYNVDDKKKVLFLSKEYNFLKETTNTKYLINNINNINKKIDLVIKNTKDRKQEYYYNSLKNKYNNLIVFIKSEEFDNNNEIIPNNLSLSEKIDWYIKSINDLDYKNKLFNDYILDVESLYNRIIKKRIPYIK